MATLERFQIKGAPTCKIVYPQGLFEKSRAKGVTEGTAKYNATIVIPKNDKEKVAQIEAEYAKAFEQLRAKGFKGKNPSAIDKKNNCLIDGDEYADEAEGREAFRGYLILKVSTTNFRPIVTDVQGLNILNGVPIAGLEAERISPEELSDGDFIFVNVSFWVYFSSAYAGIGCNPNAVVRVKEGESLGGASTDVEYYIDMGDYV